MRPATLLAVTALVLASCGTVKTDGFVESKGAFFKIAHPKDFVFEANESGCVISGDKFGIAVVAMRGMGFVEGNANLSGFANDFKKTFANSKVEAADFAGFPSVYLENRIEGATSLGYLFLLDGAQVSVNASMVPKDSIELATRILATFEVTDKSLFRQSDSKAEITRFGPSEGEPLQFGTVILIPPKGWRVMDNSTPDYIAIEPREETMEDAGMGISIMTVEDCPKDARQEAEGIASKAGVQVRQAVFGDLKFWAVEAEYQQKTYIFLISFGKRLHQVTITTPWDELGPKMNEFISSLAFKK